MPHVVAAIDQGTTSSRCMIFDHDARVVSVAQVEHAQHFPRPGWVEHDAVEIWTNVARVVSDALDQAGLGAGDVAALGISNQRETTVVWDRATGEPIARAVVWQDTRTQAENGELAFGTIDSWLLWKLTAGALHATDATNASRTMLMDLDALAWDPGIAAEVGVPTPILPEIRSSSEVYAEVTGLDALRGVPIAGILGDQHASTFGQACLSPGEAKNTYGTGNFMLLNTGTDRVQSSHGLLTTVCYALAGAAPVYALEGSIAVTGALVQWLRDNLGLISSAGEVEALARTVEDNGGAYFVPAFSGLFAPYWRSDARGALVGLTRYVNKGHIARAVLEATAFQTREVLDAMNADSGVALTELKVDGGMVQNELLMQFQADMLDVPVVRPKVAETTALGAAYAAGLAVGYWNGLDDLRANWAEDKRWVPALDAAERERIYRNWKKAVTKSFDWVDADVR